MARHHTRRGLDLPIPGAPSPQVERGRITRRVAVLGADYGGVRLHPLVQAGARVQVGTPVLEARQRGGLLLTAPASGRVAAIHQGPRRRIESVVIEVDGQDTLGFSRPSLSSSTDTGLRQLLQASGAWMALRERHIGHPPLPDATPSAIFVTATDTQPLAPSSRVILEGREEDLMRSLEALSHFGEGPVFLCADPEVAKLLGGAKLPKRTQLETFSGPHPSGSVGFHVHRLSPVSRTHVAWHIGLQDALMIGKLLDTGQLDHRRIASVAGPSALRPRLVETNMGAALGELLVGETREGPEVRVISGSVLSGRAAAGEIFGYLGRFHQQVSLVPEHRDREFLGWLTPGARRFSSARVFLSSFFRPKAFDFTTDTHGGHRAIVPIGQYERVMPMDILPTFLARALVSQDLERLEALGALELEEEDVALMTFVCPSKIEYGPLLRTALDRLEAEA